MSVNRDIEEFINSLKGKYENLFPYMTNSSDSDFDPSKTRVNYSGPYWDNDEVIVAIESLVMGKWLSSGEEVMRFERAFSKKFGFSESLMVNSGSSANLVMVAALKKYFEWSDGDEIILSVVGFPTTASAIIQNNLTPVFVDIDWGDLNWDLEQVKEKITSKTRAVFSSPVLGNIYDLDKLLEICSSKSVKVIADNCDSLGSKWRGSYLTDYSISASTSFYPAHHMTTMEGGMVSSNETEIIKTARSIAWWGRGCYCVGQQNLLENGVCKKRFSKWIPECEEVLDHKYLFENVGYNLKPLDLQGAVGIVQLKKFDLMENLRRNNKQSLDEIFSKVLGTRSLNEHPNALTSWFGKPVICESPTIKRALVHHLESNRIQTRNYFAGNLLLHPAFRKYGNWRDFPIANGVLEKVFFVGTSPTITKDMMAYVDKVVMEFRT
jgi:CDP-6-deoxy-D-xylo-4-hexulose-3-dehydrase